MTKRKKIFAAVVAVPAVALVATGIFVAYVFHVVKGIENSVIDDDEPISMV